jgi:hypothetical protein
MRNLYREFMDLMPARSLEVGDVSAVGAGMVTVTLPGGGVLQARGDATLGQRVFVRDGVVEGLAPSLTYVEAEG